MKLIAICSLAVLAACASGTATWEQRPQHIELVESHSLEWRPDDSLWVSHSRLNDDAEISKITFDSESIKVAESHRGMVSITCASPDITETVRPYCNDKDILVHWRESSTRFLTHLEKLGLTSIAPSEFEVLLVPASVRIDTTETRADGGVVRLAFYFSPKSDDAREDFVGAIFGTLGHEHFHAVQYLRGERFTDESIVLQETQAELAGVCARTAASAADGIPFVLPERTVFTDMEAGEILARIREPQDRASRSYLARQLASEALIRQLVADRMSSERAIGSRQAIINYCRQITAENGRARMILNQ